MDKREKPFVSVVIPARNEEENILDCLYAVLDQQYLSGFWEIIVVNDHSTDHTAKLAMSLADKHEKLSVLHLPDHISGKKAALAFAVQRAKGEVILQTDADCIMGANWISAMMAYWEDEVGLISGPVKLSFGDRLIEKFQAIESMGLIGIGGGSLLAGKPNMCNGANLAFSKVAFESIGGFEGIDQVASGDDELLLQKIHLKTKLRLQFAWTKDAVVSTPALKNWQTLKAQRLRWVSKARNYIDRRVNIIQGIAYLGFLTFPLLLIESLWDIHWLWGFFMAFSIKLVADTYLLYHTAVFFHNLRLLVWIIPLQFIYIPYVLWIGIAGNRVKTYNWKDRVVR